MGGVEREDVVEVKGAVFSAGIIGEEADQPGVPLLVELRADTGDQFHWGLEIDLIEAWWAQGFDPTLEAPGDFFDDGPEVVGNLRHVHGLPPMMLAA